MYVYIYICVYIYACMYIYVCGPAKSVHAVYPQSARIWRSVCARAGAARKAWLRSLRAAAPELGSLKSAGAVIAGIYEP